MYRYENPQTAAIMSTGMKALAKALPSIELEVFITNLKNNRFDYTEWRRDNVWTHMTTDEILETAAKNTENYTPSAGTQII
jgi:hypothetical protein